MKLAKLSVFSLMAPALLMAAIVMLTCCKPTAKTDKKAGTAGALPQGQSQFTDSAGSFVKVYDEKGRVCVQRSNTYYELVTAYEGSSKTPLLLKITRVDLCYADSVNKNKVYTINAKSVGDSKALYWTANFGATDIMFKDNAIVAVREGADGEEDYFKMFSLVDGRETMGYSYGSIKVSIPNVDGNHFRRYVGFTSQQAAGQPLNDLHAENLLGTIQYGSAGKSIDKAKLLLKRGRAAAKMQKTTPDMVFVSLGENTTAMEEGKTMVLMQANEAYQATDVRGFAAQFTFYFGDDNESSVITIPVVNDRMDFAHAKYDKDIFDLIVDLP